MTSSPESSPRSGQRRRGRRPKGGKLVAAPAPPHAVEVPEPNIVLHLRCRLRDLNENKFVGGSPGAAHLDGEKALGYQDLGGREVRSPDSLGEGSFTKQDVIAAKLRNLSLDLRTNNGSDSNSACFWCTCAFDNPPVYLPRHKLNGSYVCYGCFCSPECAAAHLFREDLDATCRFERFHLLNHLYRGVYGYKESIKPAPDPRYTLNKFYGNLTIEEYRESSTRSGVLLVVDQPLTRVLPELHPDSSGPNSSANPGRYRLRRRAPQSKAEILSRNFRMAPTPGQVVPTQA